MIKPQTKNVLSSYNFHTLERSPIESIVKDKWLNIREVELFKAVDHWATREIGKYSLPSKPPPDGGENKGKPPPFLVLSPLYYVSIICCVEIKKLEA